LVRHIAAAGQIDSVLGAALDRRGIGDRPGAAADRNTFPAPEIKPTLVPVLPLVRLPAPWKYTPESVVKVFWTVPKFVRLPPSSKTIPVPTAVEVVATLPKLVTVPAALLM
jgi:hypothetical protein